MSEASAITRLQSLYASREQHPDAVFALQRFGRLSERELTIVTQLMQTVAIEVEHAIEEDRQTELMRRPLCSVCHTKRAAVKTLVRCEDCWPKVVDRSRRRHHGGHEPMGNRSY